MLIGSGIYAVYTVVIQNQADPQPRIDMGAKIIYIIPHTHLDPYWLDPWSTESERWSTNVRNALDLMKRNLDMT